MLSTPPATTRSASPARTARAAIATASAPEPQRRLTVDPGTVSGRPASSRAIRATLRLSSPAWLAQPMTTSSTADQSTCGMPGRQGAQRVRGQVVRADGRQGSAVAADRRADAVDEEGLAHVWCSVQVDQGARDGAAAAAQLGDHAAVVAADRHVVEAAAQPAVPLGRLGGEPLADPHRLQERDVAAGRDGALPIAVARDGEGRVGQQEDVAAVGDVVAVDHVGAHGHGHRGPAGRDRDQLDADGRRRAVLHQHRVGAGARDLVPAGHAGQGTSRAGMITSAWSRHSNSGEYGAVWGH